MTGVSQPDIERLRAFSALRREVHRDMERKIQARLGAGNGLPTDFELEINAFAEEIEPQVWNAVVVMNTKGYETCSSGFAGEYGERQQIDGVFFIDFATKRKLATMGVSVVPYPDTYMPGQIIMFYPEMPDLSEIAAKWSRIAAILPSLNKAKRNER